MNEFHDFRHVEQRHDIIDEREKTRIWIWNEIHE